MLILLCSHLHSKKSSKLKTMIVMSIPCHIPFTLGNSLSLPSHMENHNLYKISLSSHFKRNLMWLSLVEVDYMKNMSMKIPLHGLKMIKQNKNLILYPLTSMDLDLPSCRKRDTMDVVAWDLKSKALFNLSLCQDDLIAQGLDSNHLFWVFLILSHPCLRR